MYHVCAWECGVSTCNPVKVRLVNVHIDLVVFRFFLKCASEFIIDLFPFHLMYFSTISLVSLYIGKLIDNRSTTARVSLLSMSFDPALLKTVDPELLRDRWTSAISRDMATCMERNMSVKTNENLRIDMQVKFSRSRREIVNVKAHTTTYLTERDFYVIFGRS